MAPNPNIIHPSSSFHQAVKTKGFLQLKGTEVYSRSPKHNGKVNLVKSRAVISHSNNETHVSLKKAHMDVGFALILLRKETQVSLKRIASLAIRVRSLSDLTAQNVDPMIVFIVAREREESKVHLLMALPEDHLAKFHKMTDAKEMWDAIKSRFGGNDESKKMQKVYLEQQFLKDSLLQNRRASQWV
ncbi:hypothetical protein Tco_0578493 [Tanacetum coccineum]